MTFRLPCGDRGMLANVQVQEIAAERAAGNDAPPAAEVPALPAPTPRPNSGSGGVRAGGGATIAPQVRLETPPTPLLFQNLCKRFQHIGARIWCPVLQRFHSTHCGVEQRHLLQRFL